VLAALLTLTSVLMLILSLAVLPLIVFASYYFSVTFAQSRQPKPIMMTSFISGLPILVPFLQFITTVWPSPVLPGPIYAFGLATGGVIYVLGTTNFLTRSALNGKWTNFILVAISLPSLIFSVCAVVLIIALIPTMLLLTSIGLFSTGDSEGGKMTREEAREAAFKDGRW
jgi:hypothetical protein